MSREENEWWIKKSCLHIGNTINLDEEGITIPSYRYSYSEKIKDLEIFTHPDHPEYCLIYSKSFPIFNIWKYEVKKSAVAGTTYSKFLRFPSMDVFHVNRILERPYTPDRIDYNNELGQFIIYWSDSQDEHSIFEISKDTIVYEKLPIHRKNEYIIESRSSLPNGESRSSKEEKDIESSSDDESEAENADMKMLHSPCKNYYIKYAKEFEFVDVFNSQGEFLFRLTHNVYKSYHCCMIIEFVYNKDNELRILINDQHSVLSIYDMEGKLCHNIESGDEFYTHMFRIKEDNKEYLVLYGFIWAPIYFMSIYDLEKLVSEEDYEPDQYWEKDTGDLKRNLNDCKDNIVCFGMSPNKFKAFMLEKNIKKEIALKELLNKRWNEENILKLILDEKTRVSFEPLIDRNLRHNMLGILLYKDSPNITCFGGNSGYEFKYHADDIIIKEVNHTKQNKLVIDLLARMVFSDDYEKWASNGSDLKEVNLIFTIDNCIKMQIIIPMVQIHDKKTNWFPEDDKDVLIKLEIIKDIEFQMQYGSSDLPEKFYTGEVDAFWRNETSFEESRLNYMEEKEKLSKKSID